MSYPPVGTIVEILNCHKCGAEIEIRQASCEEDYLINFDDIGRPLCPDCKKKDEEL